MSQIGPSLAVFSSGGFSSFLPAVLVGGAVYLFVSLAQGRGTFQTDSTRPGSAEAESPALKALYTLALAVLIAAFVGFGSETF